jgi:glycerol-3-phosphate dehydrogenase
MLDRIVKVKHLFPYFFILLGFSLGAGTYRYMAQDNIDKIIEETTRNEWVEAENYLAIAKAIRDKRYDEALTFSENMVERNVNSFLKNYPSPSKYEVSALKKINNYKKEDCSMKCLPNIQ